MADDHEQEPATDTPEGPSKSELKRRMSALQELGERLTQLPESQLAQIPIDNDQLAEAIALARTITARSGRRRQLQFIGKLMRKIDPEPIRQALARLDGKHRDDNARFHRLERLRDDFLANGDKALDTLLDTYPAANRQHLRQLGRQHAAETKQGKSPTAARKLFRYLRELEESSPDGGGEPPDS